MFVVLRVKIGENVRGWVLHHPVFLRQKQVDDAMEQIRQNTWSKFEIVSQKDYHTMGDVLDAAEEACERWRIA